MSHNGLRAVIAALLADRFPLSTGRKQNPIDSAICDLHGPKLTLAGTGEGGGEMQHPREVIYNGRRSTQRLKLKFCIANGASFAQLLTKKVTGLGQVTEL